MVRRSVAALGVIGGVLAALGAANLYQRATTDEIPSTVVARLDDVELRRYPSLVRVETVADSETEAFRRLFRYITGSNESGDAIVMTTPVEVTGRGTEIPMTAPVERGADDRDAVRMAFYLPSTYDAASAPRPTDEAVTLGTVPERTLAVRRFSGRPTDGRVTRETEHLLTTLDAAGVTVAGRPFFMGYDAPWTLPFLRRNEVAVEVEVER
jgi:hypothetical protein